MDAASLTACATGQLPSARRWARTTCPHQCADPHAALLLQPASAGSPRCCEAARLRTLRRLHWHCRQCLLARMQALKAFRLMSALYWYVDDGHNEIRALPVTHCCIWDAAGQTGEE